MLSLTVAAPKMVDELDLSEGKVVSAASLDKNQLEDLLWKGASTVFLQEAAVRLLIKHGYWLHQEAFLGFVKIFHNPTEMAGIQWESALSALDDGQLSADHEQASILRIAGSICTFYRLSLRDVVEGIDQD